MQKFYCWIFRTRDELLENTTCLTTFGAACETCANARDCYNMYVKACNRYVHCADQPLVCIFGSLCFKFTCGTLMRLRPVGAFVKDINIGARGLGFDSWTCQIGRSIGNGLPPLLCFLGAVKGRSKAAEMHGPRHSLHASA